MADSVSSSSEDEAAFAGDDDTLFALTQMMGQVREEKWTHKKTDWEDHVDALESAEGIQPRCRASRSSPEAGQHVKTSCCC